ncbi:MAG: hypothetical protein AAF916_07460 [Planctomycetota bacterium]
MLTRKARDVKQACPFGYWERADEDAARVANRPDVVLGRVASDVGESLNDRVRATLGWDRIHATRRGVLAGGVGGALAAWVGLPVRAQSGGEQDCYVSITPCPDSDGEKTHVRCASVDGKKADAYIRDGRDCYQLDGASLYRGSVPSEKVATSAGDVDNCSDDACVEESQCTVYNSIDSNHRAPEVDVTVSWSDNVAAGATHEDTDNDGTPDTWILSIFGQDWENGETKPLCPNGYSCAPGGWTNYGDDDGPIVASADRAHERWLGMIDMVITFDAQRTYASDTLLFKTFGVVGRVKAMGDEASERHEKFENLQFTPNQQYGPTTEYGPYQSNGTQLLGDGLAVGRAINGSHFQAFTRTDTVTVSWARGNGSWGC